MEEKRRFYLPQLDGLRFLAFFLVYIHHFPAAAHYFVPQSLVHIIFDKAQSFGWIGVDVFLCLSSFLLTSLLIMEHQNTDRISIKQFFVRRVLRIWPLYYLVLILSFTVFPATSFFSPPFHSSGYSAMVKEQLFPFTVFAGNFSYGLHGDAMTVSLAPLWTVSLEEQFYVFWPILLFVLLPRDRKWFFIALAGLVVISFAVRLYILKNNIPFHIMWVFTLARLDPFALGAVISYIYLNPRIKPRPLLALCLAMILIKMVISMPYGGENSSWQLPAVDVAASLSIYAALYSRTLTRILSIKIMLWLGKISFGLYVIHDLMIQVMIAYIMPLFLPGVAFKDIPFSYWILGFFIALALTIVCAALSYYGFERHFLKLKTRFTVIASRPA